MKPRKAILEIVARVFEVEVAELIGSRREQHIQPARQAAAWALRRAGYSAVQAGRAMHRDHSTILYAAKRALELAAEDPDYRAQLREVEREIAPRSETQLPAPPNITKPGNPALHWTLAWWGLQRAEVA